MVKEFGDTQGTPRAAQVPQLQGGYEMKTNAFRYPGDDPCTLLGHLFNKRKLKFYTALGRHLASSPAGSFLTPYLWPYIQGNLSMTFSPLSPQMESVSKPPLKGTCPPSLPLFWGGEGLQGETWSYWCLGCCGSKCLLRLFPF